MKTRDEVVALFRDKYEYLKTVYPSVGPFEESRIYQNPDGGWQMNLENMAAITLRPGDDKPHEIHDAICARWYREGGAFNENGVPGKLGYPITDITTEDEEEGTFISCFDTDWLDILDKNGTLRQYDVDVFFRELDRQNDDIDQLKSQGIDFWEKANNAMKWRFQYNVARKWRMSKFQNGIIRWRNIPSGRGHVEVDYSEIDPKKLTPFSDIYNEEHRKNRLKITDSIHALIQRVFGHRLSVSEPRQSSYLWHDEFDGAAIDSSKWSFEIGTGNNGWGNNEKEYYTDRPENAYVKDGILHIRAVKEFYRGSGYTSARMVTKGKFSFQYGMVEARIALPAGRGIWPAFWMLGENSDFVGHPACGEIDIIEAINDENVVYGTCHWFNNGRAQHGKSTADFYGARFPLDVTKFHDYKLVWNEKVISMYVDGFKYYDINIENNAGGTNAFHKPFFLILNVAVGGNWPGFEIDDSQFPNEMLVDYIRVSQLT